MTQRPPSSSRPPRRSPRPRISRREVLSAAGGAAAAGLVGVAAWQGGLLDAMREAVDPPAPTPTPSLPETPTPFSVRIDATPQPTAPRIAAGDVLEEASVASLRQGLDQGSFSIVELTQAALDRIAAMDRQGPTLGALIETNPEALDIAARLDQEARQGRGRGPLHGIPVLVKDVFATADQMRTTAGSLALTENRSIRDAFLIERLREAGAIVLGKTNLTEFSNFKGYGGASGWSARGGQTRNPHVLSFSAWGSSSGSAVAVAASYAPLAIGAETDGSILCPASACGVVGMKPTVGLVSRRGGLPISFTQDSPGPMARNVADAALLLTAIAGFDPEDAAYGEFADFAPAAWSTATPVPAAGAVDYTRGLDPDGLRGARIGVCRSLFGFDPYADSLAEDAIAAMRDAGAEIVDEVYVGAMEALTGEDEYVVLVTEFAYGIQRFLDDYMPDGPITSLADIVDFNAAHAEEALLYTGQEVLEAALYAGTLWDDHYRDILWHNLSTARDSGIDLTMDEHGLDALVAPAAGLPTRINPYGDHFTGSSAQLAAIAGYPSITVPIGQYNALPAGLHLFGRAFSEETLLRLAYGLEQTLQAREAPGYLEEPPLGDLIPSPVDASYDEEFPAEESGDEWWSSDEGDEEWWSPEGEDEWWQPEEGEDEWMPPGE